MSYNHLNLEQKWQTNWDKGSAFLTGTDKTKPKYYALDMFPYPSGLGLHVGHLASYTPTDIVARYKRAKGFNVLHPMGYDAFGLPAEQFAIQTGIHPQEVTNQAIENFRRQLKNFGFSFDWTREVKTSDPSFYKWTQFIFLKLHERGLAYQKEVPVNWCPALKTVLANEEVVDGKSERGGHPVIRMPMRQWMLKITDYAERLISDLDLVDWPEKTKEGQRNWIGKSEGAQIDFAIEGTKDILRVFTTRADTLFGVTFMVVAPEHPIVQKITTPGNKAAVDAYIQTTKSLAEVDRKAAKTKTGVNTGALAVHPFTKKELPVYIADYVLMDYGTGAIMAVPGHDERDFEFATTYKLPIVRVIDGEGDLPYVGDGKVVNSDFLNGLSVPAAQLKMNHVVEEKKLGQKVVQYKLRDWLFSRQRYWGEPFPMVHLSDGNLKALPLNELPVTLPNVADYEPTEKGEPPLARVKEFVEYSVNGVSGRRETDTMPGSAGSSWYFLRYIDPHNDKEPYAQDLEKYWMPVDLYVGGAEHTVGHLLYARFWHKVLFDAGLVSTPEPFKKLAHQGVVMGPDGQRMSKSRGNVINTEDIREKYGADAARAYICFLGPFEKDKPWDTNGIEGVRRFLERVWRLVEKHTDDPIPTEAEKALHSTIKKVGEDIESLSFNTAISAMMILVNEFYKLNVTSKKALEPLVQILAPFAPHLCEEMWEMLGKKPFVSLQPWPDFDPRLTVQSEVDLPVQVNGKMRGTVKVEVNSSEAQALELAQKMQSVANALSGLRVIKVIYKAGKVINIIAQ